MDSDFDEGYKLGLQDGEARVPRSGLPYDTQWIDCIPGKCSGQPCIRNHRLTLTWLMESLVEYGSIKSLCEDYPSLTEEEVNGALYDLAKWLDGRPSEVTRGES